jgi:hypothetical protein
MAETNFNLIDPNNEILKGTPWYNDPNNPNSNKDNLGIPPFEDIRSFVEMSFRPKNINFIEVDSKGVPSSSNSEDSSVVKLNGHFTKNNSEY